MGSIKVPEWSKSDVRQSFWHRKFEAHTLEIRTSKQQPPRRKSPVLFFVQTWGKKWCRAFSDKQHVAKLKPWLRHRQTSLVMTHRLIPILTFVTWGSTQGKLVMKRVAASLYEALNVRPHYNTARIFRFVVVFGKRSRDKWTVGMKRE